MLRENPRPLTEHKNILGCLNCQSPSVAVAESRWVIGSVGDEGSRRTRVGLEVRLEGISEFRGAHSITGKHTYCLCLGKANVVVGGALQEVLVVDVVLARWEGKIMG